MTILSHFFRQLGWNFLCIFGISAAIGQSNRLIVARDMWNKWKYETALRNLPETFDEFVDFLDKTYGEALGDVLRQSIGQAGSKYLSNTAALQVCEALSVHAFRLGVVSVENQPSYGRESFEQSSAQQKAEKEERKARERVARDQWQRESKITDLQGQLKWAYGSLKLAQMTQNEGERIEKVARAQSDIAVIESKLRAQGA